MFEVLDLLRSRRSVKADMLNEPAPSQAQLQDILTISARVPDHGKVVPFHFMVFEGRTRELVGQEIARLYAQENPTASEKKIELEANRFMRAPVVVAVIFRKRPSKNPVWEQFLTAGAVCQNLLLASQAHGFSGQWLTEWYAYDRRFKTYLGLDERDAVAGFIHIGTAEEKPEDRDRPSLEKITTYWHPDQPVNKGDQEYDRDKFAISSVDLSKTV